MRSLCSMMLAVGLLGGHGYSHEAGRDRVAQKPGAPEQQLGEFFMRLRDGSMPLAKEGNLLGQLVFVRTLMAEYSSNRQVQDAGGQLLGTFYSFFGGHDRAQALFDGLSDDPASPKLPTVRPDDSYRATPAVEAIVRAAAGCRAIFVNEAHHIVQHRLLTLALLEPLKAQGYRYFAAETLAAEDTSLNERPYAVYSTGFYTNEPLFAHVVREARRLGYILVPYEASAPGSPDARERGQAQNLKERIFDKDPGAKVLVHAGYAHIDESGSPVGAPPMAIRFKELTGIDPFTVDQTTMSERTRPTLEPSAYRELVARHAFEVPTAFVRESSVWSARPGVHDMTVFVPRTTLREGRPDWLFGLGRTSTEVPATLCDGQYPCAIEARMVDEPREAVPMDALLLEAQSDRAVLVLPPGRYRVESRAPSGRTINARTIDLSSSSKAPGG